MRRFLLLLVACGAPEQARSEHQALGPPSAASLPLSWVAIGDSTTADYSSESGGWPGEMERVWTGHAVENKAIPGSTVLDGGPGYPTIISQWLSVRDTEPRGLLQHGGFNDFHNYELTGEEIFAQMLTIADDARDAGWTVGFVSPLPCGGICDVTEDGRRLVIMGLQQQWATSNGQLFFNLDQTAINCGPRYGPGINALCAWAQKTSMDEIHPSEGAESVIGQFIVDRMQAPELLAP